MSNKAVEGNVITAEFQAAAESFMQQFVNGAAHAAREVPPITPDEVRLRLERRMREQRAAEADEREREREERRAERREERAERAAAEAAQRSWVAFIDARIAAEREFLLEVVTRALGDLNEDIARNVQNAIRLAFLERGGWMPRVCGMHDEKRAYSALGIVTKDGTAVRCQKPIETYRQPFCTRT